MKKLGVVLMIVGVLLGCISVALGVGGFVSGIKSKSLGSVATATVSLDHGDYTLYSLHEMPVQALSNVVTITGPSGEAVSPKGISGDATYSKGGRTYTGFADFKAATDGEYTISLKDASGGEVVVGPSIVSTFKKLFGPFILGGFGTLLFLIGLVLLIIGAVRKSDNSVNNGGNQPPAPEFVPPNRV